MSVPVTIDSDVPGLLPPAYWEWFWEECRLPLTIRTAAIPDEHNLFRRFLPHPGPETTLAEIGCAPGKWLHYFAREFGYSVTGIDYAPNACETTRKNLRLLEVDAAVVNADLFEYEPPAGGYDVVVTFGLIEHFEDSSSIVNRLTGFVKPGGVIASVVPNLYGPEGWVLKAVRPEVYAGHVPIRLQEFRRFHESAGMETLFSNYLGGCIMTPPLRGTEFLRKHPRLGLLANLPAIGVNRVARYVQVATGVFPRLWFASPKLIYIGRRRTA
jgi:2-polyprenyl-3-methyl-5-hydroxy-6-metoxy-1,4-benzoquinol methylase